MIGETGTMSDRRTEDRPPGGAGGARSLSSRTQQQRSDSEDGPPSRRRGCATRSQRSGPRRGHWPRNTGGGDRGGGAVGVDNNGGD